MVLSSPSLWWRELTQQLPRLLPMTDVRVAHQREYTGHFFTLLRTLCAWKLIVYVSGVLHLIFWERGYLWVTKTPENETVDKGGILFPPCCLTQAQLWRCARFPTKPEPSGLIQKRSLPCLLTVFKTVCISSLSSRVSGLNTNCLHPMGVLNSSKRTELTCPLAAFLAFTLQSLKVSPLPFASRCSHRLSSPSEPHFLVTLSEQSSASGPSLRVWGGLLASKHGVGALSDAPVTALTGLCVDPWRQRFCLFLPIFSWLCRQCPAYCLSLNRC